MEITKMAQLGRLLLRNFDTKRRILLKSATNTQILGARNLALFPRKPKEDETPLGTKTTDVAKVKEFFDEKSRLSKDASTFIETVEDFKNIKRLKRFGYAEFVQAALPAMEAFGVEKNLEAYKALMRIFPPGAFIPASKFASGFFPNFVQQQAALTILTRMERYRMMPDKEMEESIVAAFSQYSDVWIKCARMTYWLTKFKNTNVYPLPEVIPDNPMEIAIAALKRMSRDPQADISVHSTDQFESNSSQSSDNSTWIVFSQSETQSELIEEIVDKIVNKNEFWRVSLDGPFTVFLDTATISYFVLYGRDLMPKKEVTESWTERETKRQHEINDVSNIPLSNFGLMNAEDAINPMKALHQQDDGTVLAICATGTSDQESLIAFIKILERTNPALKKISVIISNKDSTERVINV